MTERLIIILVVVLGPPLVIAWIILKRALKQYYRDRGEIPKRHVTVVHDYKAGRVYSVSDYKIGRVRISKKEYEDYWKWQTGPQRFEHEVQANQLKQEMVKIARGILSRIEGADPKIYNLAKSLTLDLESWKPKDPGFEYFLEKQGTVGSSYDSHDLFDSFVQDSYELLLKTPKKAYNQDANAWWEWFNRATGKKL